MKFSCRNFLQFLVLTFSLGSFSAGYTHAVEIEIIQTTGTEARVQAFRAERLPLLKKFIEEWEQVTPLPKTLKLLFVNPAFSAVDRAILPQVYGADYISHAQQLLEIVSKENVNPAELKAVYEEMFCRFPGFGRSTALVWWDVAKHLQPHELKGLLTKRLALLLDPSVKPSKSNKALSFTHASTFASSGEKCGVLVFGYLPSNGGLAHDQIIDVVLHEAAHWIDLSSRPRLDPLLMTEGFNEAFADILAHLYLNDPCHRVSSLDVCSRDLVTPLTFAEVRARPNGLGDDHEYGQPLRVIAWKLFHGQSLAEYGHKLLQARDEALHVAQAADERFLSGIGITPELRWQTARADLDFMEDVSARLQAVSESSLSSPL